MFSPKYRMAIVVLALVLVSAFTGCARKQQPETVQPNMLEQAKARAAANQQAQEPAAPARSSQASSQQYVK